MTNPVPLNQQTDATAGRAAAIAQGQSRREVLSTNGAIDRIPSVNHMPGFMPETTVPDDPYVIIHDPELFDRATDQLMGVAAIPEVKPRARTFGEKFLDFVGVRRPGANGH